MSDFEDPIAKQMRDLGYPPEHGFIVVLPESTRDQVGLFPPKFVRFSPTVKQPVMMLDPTITLYGLQVKDRPWESEPISSTTSSTESTTPVLSDESPTG